MKPFASQPARETSVASGDHCNCSPDGSPPLTADEKTLRNLSVFSRLLSLPGRLAILVVRGYQYLISPMLGKTCRFYPSCSQYFIQCVQKFGLMKALLKGTWRICRCHPWNPGGFDPP